MPVRYKGIGGLAELGASYFSKVRWERSRGCAFSDDENVDVDGLVAKWKKTPTFADAGYPNAVFDIISIITEVINKEWLQKYRAKS